MQISYTGHNIEVTNALREFTDKKLEKLSRHSEDITNVNVTFDVEKLRQIAEAKFYLHGKEIYARSESEDMYASIDALVDKLDRQIQKHKEKGRR